MINFFSHSQYHKQLTDCDNFSGQLVGFSQVKRMQTFLTME